MPERRALIVGIDHYQLPGSDLTNAFVTDVVAATGIASAPTRIHSNPPPEVTAIDLWNVPPLDRAVLPERDRLRPARPLCGP